jgi:hypothetical protein
MRQKRDINNLTHNKKKLEKAGEINDKSTTVP